MANGIDYFPLDVDFFDDDKIALIESEFGIQGSYIALRLLCKIYREGYYYQWGGDECLLFARKAGAGIVPSLVKEVVNGLVKRSFFDKGVFDRFGILTSPGIQLRYFEASKRRQKVTVRREYLLVDVSKFPNVYISGENVYIEPKNAHISKQSKVKESKVKKNNSLSISPSFQSGDVESPPAKPSDSERETIFKIFFFKNFQNPLVEVDRFINHYAATGWVRKGEKIVDRISLARMWSAEKNTAPPFPDKFMTCWKEIYEALSSFVDCSPMWHDLQSVSITNASITLASKSAKGGLRPFIEQHVAVVKPILNKHYPNHALYYRIPKEMQ